MNGNGDRSNIELHATCRVPVLVDGIRIPCGKIFMHDPLAPQIIGEAVDTRSQRFVQGLMKHLEKKHPEEFAQIQNTWIRFMGFLVMGSFESADSGFRGSVDSFAAYLCQVCCQPVSEADIVGVLAALGLTMDDPMRQKLIGAFKHMRDFITRRIQVPEEAKPLVTL